MSIFIHTADDLIIIGDYVAPLNEFLALVPTYTRHPDTGASGAYYYDPALGVFLDNVKVADVPWAPGDAYIADEATFLAYPRYNQDGRDEVYTWTGDVSAPDRRLTLERSVAMRLMLGDVFEELVVVGTDTQVYVNIFGWDPAMLSDVIDVFNNTAPAVSATIADTPAYLSVSPSSASGTSEYLVWYGYALNYDFETTRFGSTGTVNGTPSLILDRPTRVWPIYVFVAAKSAAGAFEGHISYTVSPQTHLDTVLHEKEVPPSYSVLASADTWTNIHPTDLTEVLTVPAGEVWIIEFSLPLTVTRTDSTTSPSNVGFSYDVNGTILGVSGAWGLIYSALLGGESDGVILHYATTLTAGTYTFSPVWKQAAGVQFSLDSAEVSIRQTLKITKQGTIDLVA